MAALTITAASVAPGVGAYKTTGVAGAVITAGQVVYLDSATSTYKLTDNDSATVAARTATGIALNGAAVGQPVTVQTLGPITIGATVTVGLGYYSSPTAGGVSPVADMASTCWPTFLGFAISTTVIQLNPVAAGVAVP